VKLSRINAREDVSALGIVGAPRASAIACVVWAEHVGEFLVEVDV
jgi:hypothetical protein